MLVLVVKPVRYISTGIYHYFWGRCDTYIFDLIDVLFSSFVGEHVKRFQQRPGFDHIQKLNDFLSDNNKNNSSDVI